MHAELLPQPCHARGGLAAAARSIAHGGAFGSHAAHRRCCRGHAESDGRLTCARLRVRFRPASWPCIKPHTKMLSMHSDSVLMDTVLPSYSAGCST